MKLSIILSTFFTTALCVTSPVTNAALREYMARGIRIRSQRRLINAGFHRKRQPNPKQGKAIGARNLMQRLQKAQQTADTFAQMMEKANTYKY